MHDFRTRTIASYVNSTAWSAIITEVFAATNLNKSHIKICSDMLW